MIDLDLPQTSNGVCPVVIVVLGRRGTGKTRLLQALAPLVVDDRSKLVIVSPLPVLKKRMPDLQWEKISILNRGGIDKLFRRWNEDGVERFILADEGDELTASSAAGVGGGFATEQVYNTLNYGREQGLGIAISTRRPQNIAKDMLANANLVFVANTTDPAALDYYNAFMHDPTHPDRDYRAICQVLPSVDTDGYSAFMVWTPGRKMLGYVTVDPQEWTLREFDPEELRKPVPSANGTDPTTTTGTPSSDPATDRSGSGASSAARFS